MGVERFPFRNLGNPKVFFPCRLREKLKEEAPVLPQRRGIRRCEYLGSCLFGAGCFTGENVPSKKGERNMNIRPLGDRILVKRVEEHVKSPGGIIIPDTAKEKPMEGKVIGAGKGKVLEKGKVHPPRCEGGGSNFVQQACGKRSEDRWGRTFDHSRR